MSNRVGLRVLEILCLIITFGFGSKQCGRRFLIGGQQVSAKSCKCSGPLAKVITRACM
jgi:hypothetical protein